MVATVALLLTGFPAWTDEREACTAGAPVATVIALDGRVIATSTRGLPVNLAVGTGICPGDRIVTDDASGIDLRFEGKDSVTNILSNSTIVISMPGERSDMTLLGGLMRFISSVRSVFTVALPETDAGIDGTEAMLAVLGPASDTLVLVREGVVTATGRDGTQLKLAAGEASYAAKNVGLMRATPENVPAAFRRYLARPDRAADWAVYYPPILIAANVTDGRIREAAALLDAGKPDEAEALLAAYDGPDRAAAFALHAMIAVFTNRPQEGLGLARQALAADAGLGAAHVAESYALQALGRVDDARVSAERATMAAPSDGYAWARRAELELTVGNRTAAVDAAGRSIALTPTALGYAVFGFSMLAVRDNDRARAAFERAIGIESESPLPRLGLGLAMINDGDLAAGRRELEAAASLDPQRAQLRGWLGRGYAAEGLGEKALSQYRLAQEMDPDDPTAWLFEAEALYDANRPVEALTAVETADDKGAGRATLRGRDGLGEDEATRATAAGRIFDVLGFEDQALQAGARAVAADPTSAGSHQFLADVYRTRPGFEIAQASERLVADLLLGPSNAPIQLQLGEADLAVLGTTGPARVAFHEFSPLLTPDGIRALFSGGIGNRGTWTDEVSLAVKEGNYSIAFGQFHYETDGFVANNDVRYDIGAVQFRAEPSPGVSLFGEVKYRETEAGDLRLTAAGTVVPDLRREWSRKSLRLGAHLDLAEGFEFIAVGTIADVEFAETNTGPGLFLGSFTDTDERRDASGGDIQAQLVARRGPLTMLAGGSFLSSSEDGSFASDTFIPVAIFGGFCFPPFLQSGALCVNRDTSPLNGFDRHYSGYVYGQYEPAEWVTVTLGGSVEHLETEIVEKTVFNPKAAIVLRPMDGVTVRGAYLHTLKRPYILDQTIEPTTLGGFNQFFDDEDGTEARIVAGGIDLRPFDNVWLGGELVWRELETPLALFGIGPASGDFDTTEWRARGYLNATFMDAFAFSAGVEHTHVESSLVRRLTEISTTRVPVTISYFDPSGAFGSLTGTWMKQDLTDTGTGVPISGSDSGFLVDAVVGYRFPNKRGLITFEVLNLLDTNLRIQDETTFNNRPLTDTVARDRTFMARFTVPLN